MSIYQAKQISDVFLCVLFWVVFFCYCILTRHWVSHWELVLCSHILHNPTSIKCLIGVCHLDKSFCHSSCNFIFSLGDLLSSRSLSTAANILKEPSHQGHHLFDPLPPGRNFGSIMSQTNRFKNSFHPHVRTEHSQTFSDWTYISKKLHRCAHISTAR